MTDKSKLEANKAAEEWRMKAIRTYGSSGHATVSPHGVAVPKPAPGEVLIRVRATAVTTGELEWATTRQTPEGAPRVDAVPGREFSGVVEEVGPNTEGFKKGDAGRRRKPMKVHTIVAAICAALAFAVAEPASAHGGQAETVTPKFDQAIPNIPGKSLIILEVDYAPGAASLPHTHAKSAFIYAYVISGEIESKVNNGETRIYKAGESWSEPPNAYHPISRNASKTKPAKLLAVFVVDSDDKPLTIPVK